MMIDSIRRLCLLNVFLVCLLPLRADLQENSVIKKLNSQDGLSHNIVNDITQDDHGFLWIATDDGLNRFDGYSFKAYRFNPMDTLSISGNYIKSLHTDPDGNLWTSSRYGLNMYNPKKDNFLRYKPGQSENLDITGIVSARDGGLWISAYTEGLLYFDPLEKEFTLYNMENGALPTNYIMSVHEDREHLLWVGTGDNGILVFRREGDALQVEEGYTSSLEQFADFQIEKVFEDHNANIWFGSRQGIILFNRSLNDFFRINSSLRPHGLSDDIILDINQDYKGNIIIATQEGGVNILPHEQLKANHPGNFSFSKIQTGKESHHLSYRSVSTIFEDRDRNIWLGTFGNGINLIPSVQPKFRHLGHIQENPNSLNFDKVWGICEDMEGILWIGTDGMGLNRVNLETGEIRHYLSGESPGKLSDDAVLSALCDSRGRLWFGTYAGGLNLYLKGSDSFRKLDVRDRQNMQEAMDIRCMMESSGGDIWLGTNGTGLMKLDPDLLSFENILPEVSGIGAYDIRAIAEDKEGGLWLGTYGAGLFYYHPDNGETRHMMYDRVNQGSLKCNIIYSLHYDPANNELWIGGSQNGGLNLLNLENLTFELFDHRQGLANNTIHGIEKDDLGRIWISTNSGISLFDRKKARFFNYDRLDGVQEKEFSNGSVLKSSHHAIICFGGTAGMNYFKAEEISNQAEEIPVLIKDLKIFNRTVLPRSRNHDDSPLTNTLLYSDEIHLNHRQNNFTLGFTGIHYSNPEKITYQYKLENSDTDWIDLDKQKTVTFQNLSAGEYLFKVRATNGHAQWPGGSDSVLVSISPPPWRSLWAFVLYGLILTAVITVIFQYNLRQAKMKHNLLLEKKMRQQEHEMHEERIRFFTNISHELRTPLMLLINPLEELISRESLHTRLGKTLNHMFRSASSILQLTNTLLEFRKTETGNLKLHAAQGNIVEQIEEICLAFRGISEKKNIQLEFRSDHPQIEAWYDREKMEMIVNNLLSNAHKYTPAEKSIMVQITEGRIGMDQFPGGYVQLEVEDEGQGIPENEVKRIFERFYQVQNMDHAGGTGIGLALTKKLVELHRGTISVESTMEKGSRFTILLPKGNTHLREEEMVQGSLGKNPSESFFVVPEDSAAVPSLLEKFSSLSEKKKRILIIEDNEEIRTYLKQLLSEAFIIEEAPGGNEGLEEIRKSTPSLIISDIMMPGMDGLELCRILKNNLETSHIPILMITANLSHHTHVNSFDAGADAFITKPFKPDLLLSRIYNLLKSREKLSNHYLKALQTGSFPETKSLSKDEEFLIRVKRHIHENLNQADFSIGSLHASLGISRSVFYNKVKSLTNVSPIDLVRYIRLEKAAELLRGGDCRVSEAMIAVGFNDEKHFRQLFRKHFGKMPSEYLKEYA